MLATTLTTLTTLATPPLLASLPPLPPLPLLPLLVPAAALEARFEEALVAFVRAFPPVFPVQEALPAACAGALVPVVGPVGCAGRATGTVTFTFSDGAVVVAAERAFREEVEGAAGAVGAAWTDVAALAITFLRKETGFAALAAFDATAALAAAARRGGGLVPCRWAPLLVALDGGAFVVGPAVVLLLLLAVVGGGLAGVPRASDAGLAGLADLAGVPDASAAVVRNGVCAMYVGSGRGNGRRRGRLSVSGWAVRVDCGTALGWASLSREASMPGRGMAGPEGGRGRESGTCAHSTATFPTLTALQLHRLHAELEGHASAVLLPELRLVGRVRPERGERESRRLALSPHASAGPRRHLRRLGSSVVSLQLLLYVP